MDVSLYYRLTVKKLNSLYLNKIQQNYDERVL